MTLVLSSLLASPSLCRTLESWLQGPQALERWAGPNLRPGFELADLGFKEGQSFAGYVNEQWVAFGQIAPRHGRLHLSRLIIRPDFRGHGLGSQWVRALLNTAPTKAFGLNVYPDNQAAVRCYQRLGFIKDNRYAQHAGVDYYWLNQAAPS